MLTGSFFASIFSSGLSIFPYNWCKVEMQKRQKEGYGDTVDSPPAGEERCREAVKYIAFVCTFTHSDNGLILLTE